MTKRKRKRTLPSPSVADKANRILQIVLFGLILIGVRVWHLAVIEHDQRVEAASGPKKRTIAELPNRGSIRDRFNIPLAINKTKLQATIHYAEIADLPRVARTNGVKHYPRKEHIEALSELLGRELHLDPQRVEDLIHSKAVFYFHLPYVIKDEITEKQFYRLKVLEKDWPGLLVRRVPKRVYPKGRVASGVVGYMGAINRKEYEKNLQEIQVLSTFIDAWEQGTEVELLEGYTSITEVYGQLKKLKALSYSLNDRIGKSGIEALFEKELRGYKGKKSVQVDAKGRFISPLPGAQPAISGRRVLLSLSSELQEFAEELLIQNETIRDRRLHGLEKADNPESPIVAPWIKGGAIVALDPKTGEVLALASYPRLDPNDFVPSKEKNQNTLLRWLETESAIGRMWEQRMPLKRETLQEEKSILLTWNQYLDFLLPRPHSVRLKLSQIQTVGDALALITQFEDLLTEDPRQVMDALYPKHQVIHKRVHTLSLNDRSLIDHYLREIPDNFDKLLLLDLLRLHVDSSLFSRAQEKLMQNEPLNNFRKATAAFAFVDEATKSIVKELFHTLVFKPWREENEQLFLKEIRNKEIAENRYHKPYIDLLDREERKQFQEFWTHNRYQFVTTFLKGSSSNNPFNQALTLWQKELKEGAHQATDWHPSYQKLKQATSHLSKKETLQYLSTLRRFSELEKPLFGRYPTLRKHEGKQLEKHLASAFYPLYGFGYAKPMAYRRACPQGSLFKVVTAYEALMQKGKKLGTFSSKQALNPLIIEDRAYRTSEGQFVAKRENGKPIPRKYKGGTLTKSLMKEIGTIDLVGALQYTSNPYFALLASEHMGNPTDLCRAAALFSYGSKTGIALPSEYGGNLPTDLTHNQTGLYSFAIGQHTLVVTPLQSATMLSAIANGGSVWRPHLVQLTAGKKLWQGEDPITTVQHFPYQDTLQTVGLDFPLFGQSEETQKQSVSLQSHTKMREVPLPKNVQAILFDGMHAVMDHILKDGFWGLQRINYDNLDALQSLKNMKGQMIGKTGTAEALASFSLENRGKASNVNHSWFGGIGFPQDKKEADIVVVVYLRYGGYGKDSSPLAAQVIEKWHEIKHRKKL